MNEQERRDLTRRRFRGRCGYCGVHETDAGNELEIDHFQPRAAGGGDELDNLVYCCPACNRLKGDWWPQPGTATASRRILHPLRDDLTHHLYEAGDGRLIALTEAGAFHLERLRLNRPPLLALRQRRWSLARLHQSLIATQAEQAELRERIARLEDRLESLQAQLSRLLEP